MKLFCLEGSDVPLVDAIPVFHRWIQTEAVPGLLIDVADYSHVPEGPGVILVSHEGVYSLDETNGRRGLTYCARFPPLDTLDGCLRWSLRAAVLACRALEQHLAGRLRFGGDELEVFANDRLAAPNDERGVAVLLPEIEALMDEIYPGTPCSTTREADTQQRLSFSVRAARPVPFAELAERVTP